MAKSKPSKTRKQPEPRSFEQELEALEHAVEELEGGELTLEKAIERYESAFGSWKRCASILQSAQKRIEILCQESVTDHAGEDAGEDAGENTETLDAGDAFCWKPLQLKSLPGLSGLDKDVRGKVTQDAPDDNPPGES